MSELTAEQRNYYYLTEAERTGIHKPILAALNAVHDSPLLSDGEKGLGVIPANEVALEEIDSFPEQVQYAANIIRVLTDSLANQGWKGADLFNGEADRYTDGFLERVADGYTPGSQEKEIPVLKRCSPEKLLTAYLENTEADYSDQKTSANLASADKALLTIAERIPDYFIGLSHQRQALLEASRIWRQLDTTSLVLSSFAKNAGVEIDDLSTAVLDKFLKEFAQRITLYYKGYPHQREALIRLTQLWRQLPSREAALLSLEKDASPNPSIDTIDPVLMAFVQSIPRDYQGKGVQRNALTEGIRLWRQLSSRATALASLGIDPEQLVATTNPTGLVDIANQLDRELINFVKRIPSAYKELPHQRDALIRMMQLWREIPTRQQTIDELIEDLKRLEEEKKPKETPPFPLIVIPTPPRPARWTPSNIRQYLSASIIPGGNFSWTEATQGGTRIPPNQRTVDAIVRIARLAQPARDRIGRPFIITSWYRPAYINAAVGGVGNSRHIVGDAIDFVVENQNGNQLYWALYPWWPGGLGRYRRFPNLCHIDARPNRARWLN